jgi:metallo-beta-lactamase family protein
MADAGRIKHHLRNNLIRANATVLFVGYQAPGTLGQIIQSGAREVRIHSILVPVRAQIRSLGNYSAHADHSELMAWIKERLPAHGAIFLTHGEDEERTALRAALITSGIAGDQVVMPLLDDAFELRAFGVASVSRPQTPRIDLAQVNADWHNAYAQFIIDLSAILQHSSEPQRLAIMTALKTRLAEAAPPEPAHAPPPPRPAAEAVLHGEPSGE